MAIIVTIIFFCAHCVVLTFSAGPYSVPGLLQRRDLAFAASRASLVAARGESTQPSSLTALRFYTSATELNLSEVY